MPPIGGKGLTRISQSDRYSSGCVRQRNRVGLLHGWGVAKRISLVCAGGNRNRSPGRPAARNPQIAWHSRGWADVALRGRGFPGGETALQFRVVDQQFNPACFHIEHNPVAGLNDRERAANGRFRA